MTRRAKEKRRWAREQKTVKETLPPDAAFEMEVARQWEELRVKVEGGSTSVVPRKLYWKCDRFPVKPASRFELPIAVSEANSELVYQFGTNEFDIDFGVRFVGIDGSASDLVPISRVSSHQDPVTGRLLVAEGTVFLVFDNYFSWITEKQLSYSVTLQRPGEENSEKARTERAHSALIAQSEVTAQARDMHDELSDKQVELQKEVDELRRKFEIIEAQLKEKGETLEAVRVEKEQVERNLNMCNSHIQGLSIRMLSSELRERVFSYAGADLFSWSAVNKEWNRTAIAALERAMDGSR